ncbi:uncharacterized protein [Elaeis guineensis]|uniref:Uncharacterized protein LOC105032221 isoform X1 n=1 Tax=Elaeis guineensis var. tenera TaxID=51953 RepID=A0A6I9Q8C0_ELAGV|nr:uncharacterized protein LOC105032221 isoform X1 [Elaeis guineensis]
MASTIVDGALFLLLALLFPLHLLSLGRRLLRRSGDGRYLLLRSGVLLASVAVLLSAALSDLKASSRNDAVVSELEEMELKIARLESFLEENTKILNSKTLHLEEKNKLIEEMEYKIQLLQNALHSIKKSPSDSSYSEDRITAMEEEVQLLWNESRENNFKIHTLESLVDDEEEEMKAVASEVDKMKNIVTEQWIQIRQLEQAFQSTKIMASNVRKRIKSEDYNDVARHIKCAIMKVLRFIKGIHHRYSPEIVGLPDSFFLAGSFSKSFISQAYNEFKRIMSFALECHHELQDVVKDAMEMNKFTAPLANKEVAFFVAYAIMTFPILSAWVFCSSCFS